MHLHILGICGTFMGGIAALAAAAGHRVTGSDKNVYPPMSTQLRRLGIDVIEGFDPAQLEPAPDCVVVGNAMTRGNPAVEAMLERGLPYCSGPEWLARHVLRDRHVIAVAGTHGKTTTSSMLAWILADAGIDAGFLIGGVPANFDATARLGSAEWFVVEADEYDTAFFDKRAKFVNYRPRTVVLNNLEFDHADIYDDLDAIVRQFHHLVRTVPRNGRVVVNAADANLAKVLAAGCWTPVERFGVETEADWRGRFLDAHQRRIAIEGPGGQAGQGAWLLGGLHNLENAVAAIAGAASAGVTVERAVDALSRFTGVQRRMQRTATLSGIAVYDDFAHHPTAIRRSLAAMKQRFPGERVVVALEPRSNTMKLGVHNAELAAALADADLVFVYRPAELGTDFDAALETLGARLTLCADYDGLVEALADAARPGDHVVFMSNGGFGGARQKLTAAIRQRSDAASG
jgi:UDP-N-acetylmuramate: L-alanyl-gamma-D-glutamyl-meso-diaminopimelate ligase